ncbi:MAG: hypothetical protein J6B44_03980 [Muribaculaceae bacterium]|nr:hypothetical protein [Muribaculaceae bacterium]
MKPSLRHLYFLAVIISISVVRADAQPPQLDDEGRQRWMTEIRNYKHDFFTKELELSEDQQRDFFAEYDQMEDRINKLNSETRELEEKTIDNPDASDVELEATARALFEIKGEESKIELEYFEKFKNILQPKQLVLIKNTERKFTQQLVQHHRRLRSTESKRRR